MGARTNIGWTESTWNPVSGCTKISRGCDHCYAFTLAERFRGTPGHYYENGFDLTPRPHLLTAPLRWTNPRMIFVNSTSDLFHAGIEDDYLADVFAVMAIAQAVRGHAFQILTKRHGRMRSVMNSPEFRSLVARAAARYAAQVNAGHEVVDALESGLGWPLPGVWLGVSVEDQQAADLRIGALLETPAAVRFLSCEPLLGPVDLWGPLDQHGARPKLTYWLDGRPSWAAAAPDRSGVMLSELKVGPRIDWVIVGGESGPGARRMDPAWARQIRDQCAHSQVAFFFKQAGTVLAREWGVPGKGEDPLAWPEPFDRAWPRAA